MTTKQKTFTKEEYDNHGEWMFDHGKCVAYQDTLKTEVKWCVSMVDRNWYLDTVIIGDGSLKNIRFVNSILTDEKDANGDYIPEYIYTTAKDATVREIFSNDTIIRTHDAFNHIFNANWGSSRKTIDNFIFF